MTEGEPRRHRNALREPRADIAQRARQRLVALEAHGVVRIRKGAQKYRLLLMENPGLKEREEHSFNAISRFAHVFEKEDAALCFLLREPGRAEKTLNEAEIAAPERADRAELRASSAKQGGISFPNERTGIFAKNDAEALHHKGIGIRKAHQHRPLPGKAPGLRKKRKIEGCKVGKTHCGHPG